MIRPPAYDPDAPIVVIDIGNTRTNIATWRLGNLHAPLSIPTGDETAFVESFAAHANADTGKRPAAAAISSVVPDAMTLVSEHTKSLIRKEALVVGETLPLPLEMDVANPHGVGVDRVCAAAAAYDRLQAGCTVVSFGTAITVDLVSDEGAFMGGAILPGIRMQMRALHEFTAQLPEVTPAIPDIPYGRDTDEAIQTGVCRGVAGAVRGLVEAYATALNRWPQVVATGGDAELMAPLCDYIDTFATHLVLRGVGLAYMKYLFEKGA